MGQVEILRRPSHPGCSLPVACRIGGRNADPGLDSPRPLLLAGCGRADGSQTANAVAPAAAGGAAAAPGASSSPAPALDDRYVVRSMELRDLKVRLFGDIAVVRGVDEEVTSLGGKDTSGKWTFTDVFARRDGLWVAVASHTSEVEPTGR